MVTSTILLIVIAILIGVLVKLTLIDFINTYDKELSPEDQEAIARALRDYLNKRTPFDTV